MQRFIEFLPKQHNLVTKRSVSPKYNVDAIYSLTEIQPYYPTFYILETASNRTPKNMLPAHKKNFLFLHQDYWTIGQQKPRLDPQQDWMLTYSREENGVTTLGFYRRRDTNDSANDIRIQV